MTLLPVPYWAVTVIASGATNNLAQLPVVARKGVQLPTAAATPAKVPMFLLVAMAKAPPCPSAQLAE